MRSRAPSPTRSRSGRLSSTCTGANGTTSSSRTVYGSDGAREALLGQVQPPSEMGAAARRALPAARRLLRPGRRVRLGRSSAAATYTPDLVVTDDPTAWHPDDALFVPMRGAGRRAARHPLRRRADLRPPAERRRDRRPRRGLASTRRSPSQAAQEDGARAGEPRRTRAAARRLDDAERDVRHGRRCSAQVCVAISEALGFEKVAVQLLDDDGLPLHSVRAGRLRRRREHRRPALGRRARAAARGRSSTSRAAS